MIRILVNGAYGKMGKLCVDTILQQQEFILAATTGRLDDLADAIRRARPDVVVDLTNAKAVLANANKIIDVGKRPVIGTSGLSPKEVAQLQERCTALQLGGIIAPNFSLGAVLLIKYAQQIVKYFPQVEIIEMHHADKLDSPSGTALQTAKLLAAARTTLPKPKENTHETIPGARGACYQEIAIHSVRLPGLLAQQQILFGKSGETLTLRHDSLDRQCFMSGIVLACKKVMELNELMYGLENIL